MTVEMRKQLAQLPYAEKLWRVAELIAFSRRFKITTPRNVGVEKDTEVSR